MNRQRLWGGLALLMVTILVIAAAQFQKNRAARDAEAAYQALLDAAPVAELTGESLSPDGRFEVRTVGKSDTYINGVRLPERLEIADTETGTAVWKDMGYVTQSVLWSPDSRYLALAYGARTWGAVKVFETENWSSWDFALPDGVPIPEYIFLPEDWGVWRDENTLELTVGRGGDGEEQETYSCSVWMADGQLNGNTYLQITECLPGDWDFDHDGEPEIVTLVSHCKPWSAPGIPMYELRVAEADETVQWMQDGFNLSHAGWGAILACTVEGQDYLLRYCPTMYLGAAGYNYQIFSLDEDGGEVLLTENEVEFDISFGAPHHTAFDAGEIADFLWEIRGYLEQSTILLSTLEGEFSSDIPGLELRYYPFGDLLALDSREATESAVRQMETAWKTEQGCLK